MRLVEAFPPPEEADADGLVAIGGDLSPRRLLLAYESGIFPWYSARLPILWWSPDPRAVLEFDGMHVARRLAREIRRGDFLVTFNRAFEDVVDGCAARPGGETWITREMAMAYARLHRVGHAHSVEVWCGGQLAGGVYGVSIGDFFAAESMFHRKTNMSKIALYFLVDILRRSGFRLLDIQILSDHTRSLGGTEIPRRQYLDRLAEALPGTSTLPGHRPGHAPPPDGIVIHAPRTDR